MNGLQACGLTSITIFAIPPGIQVKDIQFFTNLKESLMRTLLLSPFTPERIKDSIKDLKKGKSSGNDTLASECYIYASSRIYVLHSMLLIVFLMATWQEMVRHCDSSSA